MDNGPERIFEIVRGFQGARVVLTAYELDVCSAIGAGEADAAGVARECGSDTKATDRLLDAMCVLGLLEKRGDKFHNTPAAARYLVKSSPEYLSGMMHMVHLWDTWGTMTEAVRRGTMADRRPINERGEDWLKAFITAMHANATPRAGQLAGLIDLAGVKRVLDVGGGSGAYSFGFVRAQKGLTATIFDLPNVVPITRGFIEREAMQDRVDTTIGDYTKDDLPRGFDLVWLSQIIHSNSPEENRALISKCAGALNARGRILIQDFIVDDGRVSPPGPVMFALNMLVGTQSGDTYTASEVREWMEAAGLSGFTRIDTPFGTTLLSGTKL